MRRNIQTSLKLGKQGVTYLTKIFDSYGFTYKDAPVKCLEYDLNILTPLQFTVEVKYDIYEQKSGNLAIEIWNSKQNKRSGLSATTANIWCHVLSSGVYIANTILLREWVDNHSPLRIIDKGGDNNATLLLYNSEYILKEIFYQLDNLDIESGTQLIQRLI